MFRVFRGLSEALRSLISSVNALNEVLQEVVSLQRETGPATDRLENLEKRQAMWQVEMEALVAEAKGKYVASMNAEARTRTMKKHYEKLADPFAEEGEEVDESVPSGDAPGGQEQGVLPLRLGVAPNHKAQALRYKFLSS